MIIRFEQRGDAGHIRDVHLDAFDSDSEANIVDSLRRSSENLISLVAEEDGKIIGHILFSPVALDPEVKVMGLAPMAVVKKWQRKGVGSKLVEKGLEVCKDAGCDGVVVLGHPEYYPQFGFVPAANFEISSDYDVPLEVFMALELKPGSLKENPGTARYHRAFDKA